MTYKYIVKWRKAPDEYISVEAWPRDKSLALPEERRKPSFVVGKLTGTRCIMLWGILNDMIQRYSAKKRGRLTRIELPAEDTSAMAEAFRLGLAAAALNRIKDEAAAENTHSYLSKATIEEIWFWASKYLGVIDEGISPERVIEALTIISTA